MFREAWHFERIDLRPDHHSMVHSKEKQTDQKLTQQLNESVPKPPTLMKPLHHWPVYENTALRVFELPHRHSKKEE